MKRLENLLVVATADPVSTGSLLDAARGLARVNNASITLLSVVEADHDRAGFRRRLTRRRHRYNAAVVGAIEQMNSIGSDGDGAIRYEVAVGVAHEEVLNSVASGGHDLVLVAEPPVVRWSGASRNTVAWHLLRKCPVPVWVHSPPSAGKDGVVVGIGPVGAGKDTEQLNVDLLETAAWLARAQRSRLHVVHAWCLDGDSAQSSRRLSYPWVRMDEMARSVVVEARAELEWLIDRAGLTGSDLSLHIQRGHSDEVLIRAISDIGPRAVVMGTRARTGVSGLVVGNTVERVVATTNQTVLAVKSSNVGRPSGSPLEWDPAMLPY